MTLQSAARQAVPGLRGLSGPILLLGDKPSGTPGQARAILHVETGTDQPIVKAGDVESVFARMLRQVAPGKSVDETSEHLFCIEPSLWFQDAMDFRDGLPPVGNYDSTRRALIPGAPGS